MKDAILIKGNKHGLTIHMDDSVPFDSIKEELIKKLSDSRKFFGNAKVNVILIGRTLETNEYDDILSIVEEYSDLEVVALMDEEFNGIIEKTLEENRPHIVEVVKEVEVIKEIEVPKKDEINLNETTCFHRGTLRSGQEVVSDTSIVVIGNVNDGAKVVSKGNVVIIGKLTGYVTAGSDGDESAIVVALQMNPSQIRIGNKIARSNTINNKRLAANQINPQIAFVEDEHIMIDDISQSTYDNLSFK